MFDTPVLLVAFNRPNITVKMFNQIKSIKPAKLYLAVDGPRKHIKDEEEKVNNVKAIFEREIDWYCEVKKLYQSENLGCRNAVSTAINWFFQDVPEGIILEDDVLPNESFFSFAQTMLNNYRNCDEIMHISGVNYQNLKSPQAYFSKYPQIWGWATWKRAWQKYDVGMSDWREVQFSNAFEKWCMNIKEHCFWMDTFNAVYEGRIDTWDYQWVYTIMKNNGLCIMPGLNLVSNIGFDKDGTHNKDFDIRFANRQTYFYDFKQETIKQNKKADAFNLKYIYNLDFSRQQQLKTFIERGFRKITAVLKS